MGYGNINYAFINGGENMKCKHLPKRILINSYRKQQICRYCGQRIEIRGGKGTLFAGLFGGAVYMSFINRFVRHYIEGWFQGWFPTMSNPAVTIVTGILVFLSACLLVYLFIRFVVKFDAIEEPLDFK